MTILQYILVFVVLILLNKLIVAQKSSIRISGSQFISSEEYPYAVQISIVTEKQNRLICTGSVIASSWTLTAGHCVEGIYPNKSKFVIVYIEKDAKASQRLIEATIRYPGFNIRGNQENDIGLLKHERVPITEFGKISSIDYETLYGQACVVAGYGLVDEKGTLLVNKLQVLDGVVILCQTSNTVNRVAGMKAPLLYPNFCVARKCYSKLGVICSGDSGGPLIHKSGIIGISSRSFDCSSYATKEVGVFIPISIYVNWIKKTIGVEKTKPNDVPKIQNSRRQLQFKNISETKESFEESSLGNFSITIPRIITLESGTRRIMGKGKILKFFSRKVNPFKNVTASTTI